MESLKEGKLLFFLASLTVHYRPLMYFTYRGSVAPNSAVRGRAVTRIVHTAQAMLTRAFALPVGGRTLSLRWLPCYVQRFPSIASFGSNSFESFGGSNSGRPHGHRESGGTRGSRGGSYGDSSYRNDGRGGSSLQDSSPGGRIDSNGGNFGSFAGGGGGRSGNGGNFGSFAGGGGYGSGGRRDSQQLLPPVEFDVVKLEPIAKDVYTEHPDTAQVRCANVACTTVSVSPYADTFCFVFPSG